MAKKSKKKQKKTQLKPVSEKTSETAIATKEPSMLARPQAEALQKGIIQDLKAAESSVVAAAIKLEDFKRGRGWVALGFPGMTEWRKASIPESQFYNARSAMKLLDAGVPTEDVEKMPLTNINTMARSLPESDWKKPEVLRAAQGPIASFEQFATKRSDDVGMNVEELVGRGFRLPLGIAKNLDLALAVAETVDQLRGVDRRVEVILATYLNSASETPGRSRLQMYYDLVGERKAS
jgi:hypothetical protein